MPKPITVLNPEARLHLEDQIEFYRKEVESGNLDIAIVKAKLEEARRKNDEDHSTYERLCEVLKWTDRLENP